VGRSWAERAILLVAVGVRNDESAQRKARIYVICTTL
jgi:hypothetical protein